MCFSIIQHFDKMYLIIYVFEGEYLVSRIKKNLVFLTIIN